MRKTARQVLAEVADRHRIDMADLIGPCRQYRFSRPRMEAYFRIYTECPHLSFPAIGRAIGGRDHTTILSGVKAYCRKTGIDYNRIKRHGPVSYVPRVRSVVTPSSFDAYRGAVRYAV